MGIEISSPQHYCSRLRDSNFNLDPSLKLTTLELGQRILSQLFDAETASGLLNLKQFNIQMQPKLLLLTSD